ncbi:MAG: DUF4416 family protein [Candidatus Nanoarchaeia archaeon]|nr:DUF4416 family protein [Candidatus Nanoarchaeia archaeon]
MKPLRPKKVKLFCGMTHRDMKEVEVILKRLEKKFGKIESISDEFSFNFTDYYTDEIGTDLKKKFIIFRDLIDPEEIVKVKLFTNKLENKYSINGKRIFNLDPGYLNAEHLILPSAKPRPHRVYLRKGIYADMIYVFGKNEVFDFKHTFPDFKQDFVKKFFLELRKKYLEEIKH